MRTLYGAFETGLKAPTGRVYRHEIPGGQLSNLRQQADAVGLAGRFEEVERRTSAPTACSATSSRSRRRARSSATSRCSPSRPAIDFDELERRPGSFDLPDSVIDFLRGGIGTPPGGFPQPFTELALAGRAAAAATARSSTAALAERLQQPGMARRAALAEILFPGPASDFAAARDQFGDVSLIPTPAFFRGLREDEELAIDLAPGVRLLFELEAIGEPDKRGMRTVLVRVNGQLRPVEVRDRSVKATGAQIERADPSQPGPRAGAGDRDRVPARHRRRHASPRATRSRRLRR